VKIYVITLILVSIFLFFAGKYKKDGFTYNLNLFVGSLILVLFAGFRASSVGTDTNNYVGIFKSVNRSNLTAMDTSLEYLFIILNKIAYFFFENHISLLISIAIITIYFNIRVITKLSVNLWLSVFLYITLGGYVFFFNGARQGIAVAIFGMAILQIYDKNFKRYIFWVFIAVLFHRTAIVMLPLYFLNFNKFSLKKSVAIGFLFTALIMSMSMLLNLASDDVIARYSAYKTRGASGAYILTLFYVINTIFLIYFKNRISILYLKEYNFFLNLCVVHTLVYLAVQFTGVDINLIRLASYFQLGFILIYPIIFKEVKMFKELLPRLLFLGVHIFFYYVYLLRMSSLVPYTFNPILNF
jgi:transmembrane protein EpsG